MNSSFYPPSSTFFTSWAIEIYIIMYVIQAISWYKLAEKANVKNRWLAFIPFLQFILFFHIINKSGWFICIYFLSIIPVLGPIIILVLQIIWSIKFYQAFAIDTIYIVIALIIPFAAQITFLYMAFSDNVNYQLVNEYTED